MKRALPIVALLLLAGAAAYLLATGGDGTPGPLTGAPDVATEADGGALTADAPQPSVGGTPAERRSVERLAAEAVDDPFYTAALSGFRGRVVRSDRTPVEGSLVQLLRLAPDVVFTPRVGVFADDGLHEPHPEAGETRTDAEGRFLLTGVEPHALWLFLVDVGGEAPTSRVVQRMPGPGEIVDVGDIVLQDCGVLVGTVVGPDGNPVAGALVRAADLPGAALAMVPFERLDPHGGLIVKESVDMVVEAPAWFARRFEQLPIPRTMSGPDGTFRLTGVPAGSNLVAITAAGLMPNVRPRVLVRAGEERDLGRVRLAEGEILEGRVLDADDRPIAGAEVLVASETPAGPVHFASHAGPTDAEGRFRVAGLPPRRAVAAARRPGDPWMVGELAPAAQEYVLRLPSAHTLTVVVKDQDGGPVDGARLQVTPGRKDYNAVGMAMWGAVRPLALDDRLRREPEGRLVVENVPPGRYVLVVAADGHSATAEDLHVEGDLEKAITLGPERGFDVEVVDARGDPVRFAAVWAMGRGAGAFPDVPVHAGRTDAEGRLRVSSVSASEVRLTAAHPAFGNTHAEAELPARGAIRLTFADPAVIEGVLTEGGVAPTPGKWMVAIAREGRGEADGAMPDLPRLAVPDAEGRFVARGLRPGSYELSIQESLDFLTSPGKVVELATRSYFENERPESEVSVAPGATAHVVLDALAEESFDGPTVRLSGTATIDGRSADGYVVRAFGQGVHRRTREVERGEFDFGAMPVGGVSLSLVRKPDADSLFAGGFGGEAVWQRHFELEAGHDVHLTIEVATVSLEGQVLDPTGAPVEGVTIRAQGRIPRTGEAGGEPEWDMSHFATDSDGRGRFRFAAVPAGHYTLSAAHRDFVGRLDEIDVSAPVSGVLVRLERTWRVRGRVDFTAVGGPPQNAWLNLEAEDGGDSHGTSIADDGSFEVARIASGTHRVRVWAVRDGRHEPLHGAAPIEVRGDLEDVVVRAVRPEPEPPEQRDG